MVVLSVGSRRGALGCAALSLLLAAASGCSAIYDFGSFRVGPSDAGLDAAGPPDAEPLDAEPLDAGVDPIAAFLTEFTASACAKATRCEGKLGALGILETLCHPGLSDTILDGIGFTLPGATLDVEAAAACLSVLSGPDCSFGGSLSSCGAVIRGPVPDGESCTSGALTNDCASGACAGAPCGRCAPRGVIGDACDGATDPPCREPLHCRAGICSTYLGLGDACFGEGCGEGLLCNSATPAVCAPLPNVGEACQLLFLDIDPCRGSLVCHQNVCTDGGAPGAACGGATDLPCRPGLRCGPTGTCVSVSLPGGACLSRANCPVAFECVGEVCVPLPVDGEVCSPTLPCVEGGCSAGRCAPRPDGATCPTPLEPFWDLIREVLGLDFECAGRCDGTMCVPILADGASCTDSAQCRAGASCADPGTGGVCTACPP